MICQPFDSDIQKKIIGHLHPDLALCTFSATVNTRLTIAEPNNLIVWNFLELNIHENSFTTEYCNQDVILVSAFDELISVGDGVFKINFSRSLDEHLRGLYRCTYWIGNQRRKLLPHSLKLWMLWDVFHAWMNLLVRQLSGSPLKLIALSNMPVRQSLLRGMLNLQPQRYWLIICRLSCDMARWVLLLDSKLGRYISVFWRSAQTQRLHSAPEFVVDALLNLLVFDAANIIIYGLTGTCIQGRKRAWKWLKVVDHGDYVVSSRENACFVILRGTRDSMDGDKVEAKYRESENQRQVGMRKSIKSKKAAMKKL
ncbi:Aminopeptidase M1 [Linum perenne]